MFSQVATCSKSIYQKFAIIMFQQSNIPTRNTQPIESRCFDDIFCSEYLSLVLVLVYIDCLEKLAFLCQSQNFNVTTIC